MTARRTATLVVALSLMTGGAGLCARGRAGPRRQAGTPAPLLLALGDEGAARGPSAPRRESFTRSADLALEGDPFRGRIVFADKHCVQCHAVWGHGGGLGPEITRLVAGSPLPLLIGQFWNHTPRMIDEMVGRGYEWPTLTRQEMADLLSYLYYLRLFDEPGDSARGAATYARHRCDSCHSLGGEGGTLGGSLDRFAGFASPVPLAQAMWNAGPVMERTQLGRGTPIPEFSGSAMADIQAYIRERGKRDPGEPVALLSLPNPAQGGKVFRAKDCAVCHEAGRFGAPKLGETALHLSVAEISGVLWNHGYAMQARMQAAGVRFPKFEGNELLDLISYLQLLAYQGRPGDSARGAAIFRAKGCAVCHPPGGDEAPDLAASHGRDDAVALAAAMWNHAPRMFERMAKRGVPWPKFEAGQMEDLLAYVRGLGGK